jgi:non-ribosomal peptide synthetase component F
MALRIFPTQDKTFVEFLNQLTGNTLRAFENQEYQFEDLVNKLSLVQDPSRNPIFDAAYTLTDSNEPSRNAPGTAETAEPPEVRESQQEQPGFQRYTTHFDITLTITVNEVSTCWLDYSTKLFKKETIEIYMENLKDILSIVLENKNIRLKDIKISHALSALESDIPAIDFKF